MRLAEVNALLRRTDQGNYAGALEKLNYDILQKTDGYVIQSKIDGNDWVIDADIQTRLLDLGFMI